MRQTETNGWIVRNSSIITRRTLRLAVVPLSLGLIMAGAARAADDDRSISEKFVDSFYSTIRGTNLEKSSIDYRERSPLVVPPTLDLPPPAPSAGDGKIANWPKDPDERQRKAVIAAKKKNAPPPGRVLVSTDGTTGAASVAPQPINIAPPVEEAQAAAGPKRPADAAPNSVAATDPIYDKPGDLFTGGASALSDWGGGLFGKKTTTVPVQPGTEPVREALTQPPVGYQVPSSNYAYGLPAKGLFDGQANPDRNPNAQASSASSVVH